MIEVKRWEVIDTDGVGNDVKYFRELSEIRFEVYWIV